MHNNLIYCGNFILKTDFFNVNFQDSLALHFPLPYNLMNFADPIGSSLGETPVAGIQSVGDR